MTKNLRTFTWVTCLSFGLSLVGFTGCASSGDRFRTAGQYKQDQEVAGKVKNALNQAPVYKFPDVNVSVYQGRAQLSGFVATEAQKRDAAKIASEIPGVFQVENDLLLKQSPGEGAVGGATAPGGSSSSSQ